MPMTTLVGYLGDFKGFIVNITEEWEESSKKCENAL